VPSRQWFAIAAIGRDRPGIVADLSEFVYGAGCNLEDASMTMLGNEFATLMLVSGVGDELATTLSDNARKLEWERRLTVFIRPLQEPPEIRHTSSQPEWTLTATGVDKAGIVASVARCLAERGALITDLRGRIAPMPESGTPLYVLTLRMSVPQTTRIGELRTGLETIAARLDVEIDLHQSEHTTQLGRA
jgi:glycine cleavage system transcriptional repressor